MNSQLLGARKVVIAGAGAVDATFAYALAHSGISDEIKKHERMGGPYLFLIFQERNLSFPLAFLEATFGVNNFF